jgi:uncharacterized protein
MRAYFNFILRHRFLVLAVVAALTAVAGAIISRGVFASTIGGLFLGEDPAYHRYLERIVSFGNNEVLIVAIPSDDALAASNQKRLDQAVETIRTNQYVRSVRSVLDVQHLTGENDELIVETYAEQALDSPENLDAISTALRSDPMARDVLISKDGKFSAVIVELPAETDIPAEESPILIKAVVDAFVAAGYPEQQIHLVGFPASVSAIIQETRFNIERLFPIVCLALLLAVWLMFRRLWPVALTGIVSLIAVIWTLGFSVLLDRQISVLASMIPPVIMIIAFSDVVHLCSAYLLELGRDREKRDAIMRSGTDVGRACLLTSVTTFLGFVAMSFVPAPAFRHLGIVLGFGVGVALLLAVTLVPIFFSILPQPKPWRVGSTGKVQDALDGFLSLFARISTRRPWAVVAGFSIFLVICAFGLLQVEIETEFTERLPEKHKTRTDAEFFKENFAGATMLDMFIWTEQKDGLMNPDLFGKIAALQDTVEARSEVAHTFSLVDLMTQLHTALAGPDAGELPDSRNAYAQYLLLFEMSGGEDLERLIDFNRQTMRLTVQLPNEAVRAASDSGEEIQRIAEASFGPDAKVEVSGLIFLMGRWLDEIISGQQRGLMFAFFTIAGMMMLGLRSVRAGLWSMIPNMLPLIALGGWLGLTWDQVDSDVLGMAMIAIGIGVDDTIHFLMRYRIESLREPDKEKAIQNTFHFSGRGIVITTVILVTGFVPFAITGYLSVKMMGTLLPLTLIVALLADILLVPALATLGAISFRPKDAAA